MELIIFWVVCAVVVGIIGGSRGRNGFGWFLLSLIISPILALILVLALPSRRAQTVMIAGQPALMTSSAPTYYDPKVGRTTQQPIESIGMKKCPECAEVVQAEARVCRFCRHRFADA